MSKQTRILILRGGAIGDFILTLPAIAALRRRWPDAYIELAGYPRIAQLVLGAGLVDAVTSLDQADVARWFSLKPSIPDEQARHIRSFDVIVSYLYDPDGTVRRNMLAAGARQVIAGTPIVSAVHAVRHLFKPLEELGLYPEGDDAPLLTLAPAHRARGRERADGIGRALAALHPGSGSPKKNWPLERFLLLAERLRDEAALTPVFILGEAEAEQAAELEKRRAAWPRVQNRPLIEIAGFLAACRAYVGNDSGITHTAAALGIPVVALFGPASPKVWEPLGPRVRVLRWEPDPDPASASADAARVCAALKALLSERGGPA